MDGTVGPYRIESELGRGGMGVVYLATDTRLDRKVAIKSLPAELASDPARLERFEREAKTLAQLNHPNLAGIHGVEEQDGARYLVLEFVEGESLADRLDRGPLPVDEAIELAAQIAAGVEAAHDAGVIHRDLKPANVMITPEGQAKVLDFGLARTDDGAQSSTGTLDSPTKTNQPQHSPTIAGAILGTAAYMSPEQARGRRVDKRTDIWSFGVVLYEMLVGASPFHGETATDSIGAVLHKDLDLALLPRETPMHVRRVLSRCLARDKSLRYRDIGDVRVELMSGAELESTTPATMSSARTPGWLAGALAATCVVLAGVSVWLLTTRTDARSVFPVRLTIEPPADTNLRLSGDLSGPAVVSRDGSRVVFAAIREGETRRLWLRELASATSRELNGTDGAMFPFWSPDGRYIGFFTSSELRAYDTVSDTIQRICHVSQGRGAAWTDDGRIIFAPRFRGGLVVVSASGGEPTPLTEIDEELHTSHRWPVMIPGTSRFLFSAITSKVGDEDNNGIYLASLDEPDRLTRVMQSDFSAGYANGHLLFVRDGALLAQPFDSKSGRLFGQSHLLARDLDPDLSTWHGQFSVSRTGTIVYGALSERYGGNGPRQETYSWNVKSDRIASFSETGRQTTTYAVDFPIRSMDLSPDGRTIAFETFGEDGGIDIWLHPTAYTPDANNEGLDPALVREAIIDPRPMRFTSLPGSELAATWSPDGSEIAFRWDGDDTRPRGIYRKRLGDGVETLVRDNDGGDDFPVGWTPDGAYLIVTSDTMLISDLNDIWALPVEGGDMIPLVVEPGTEVGPAVSPDGRWLAYTRIEDGRWETRVIPFAPAWPEHQRDRQWVVSQGSGIRPRWSPEGDELYFIDRNARLLSVDVDITGESFVFSTPRELFLTPWDIGRTFSVLPEGVGRDNHFLFTDQASENETPIAVVLNWHAALGAVGERRHLRAGTR